MKLMVLDGNSIANRAYYGIRPLTTQDGFFTHAIYGFLMTMQRLTEEETPDALCVTFDLPAPTFRHKAYAAYKGTRHKMPEELAMQMPVLREVLDAMRIPCYTLEGYEADDLLGTISRRCEQQGWDCVIVTGDKDSLQLITEHTKVKLVTTRMGQTTTKDMTPETFTEAYGFAPIHMIDLKALMGDTSDNIPGVAGIGEKTAMALIAQYGSIDKIYADIAAVDAKPNVIKKLQEGEDSARASYDLVRIVTDAPLTFAPEDALRKEASPALYPLFVRLSFHKLIEKFNLHPTNDTVQTENAPPQPSVICVESAAQASEWFARWRGGEPVAIHVFEDLSSVCAICRDGEQMQAVLFAEDGCALEYRTMLCTLFSEDIPKVAHSVKELQHLLLEQALPADGFVFDTALAAYLLDATAGNYELSRLYGTAFGAPLPPPSPAPDVMAAYAGAVAALYPSLRSAIDEREMQTLYDEIELPLCRVLAEMELAGCRVNAQALSAFEERMNTRIDALQAEIYELAEGTFNINSPKQLGEILFERLGLPHGKRTKTGWSTNAEVLEKLSPDYPIVAKVLQYRQYAKLRSTYCEGLRREIAADGRIHTCFQMMATATGRLSSTEPNLQNIPTRTELGSELREMFLPEEGCVLVDADYSQIELRILAHIADDETMRNAFCNGADIHTVTASEVFGVPVEEVTKQQRSGAKAVNFGIVYGISAFSLAQDIGVPVYVAKEYIDNYLARFDGIRRYREEIVAQAAQCGYAETILHRRRALPELTSTQFAMRAFGERVALNMPIQGTAADIIKLAMVRVAKRLQKDGLRGRLILQIHDELIVECPEEEAERTAALLTEEMEQVMSLSVPLTAEAHWGKNWLEAKG